MMLHGMRVIESVYLTEAGDPVVLRRSWRERLLTRPWRPWTATKVVVPQVPMRGGVVMGNTIVMHPRTVRTLMQLARQEESGS